LILGLSLLNCMNQASQGQGLLAHWPLDETSGTTAADDSGNGLDATLYNGASFTTGKFGNAVTFDGSDDYAATSATSLGLNNEAALSLALWVNTTTEGGDFYAPGIMWR